MKTIHKIFISVAFGFISYKFGQGIVEVALTALDVAIILAFEKESKKDNKDEERNLNFFFFA